MDRDMHPVQGLREAEIELRLARQLSDGLDVDRLPWQELSPGKFAALSGILILLEDAARKRRAADADPRSQLATTIRDLEVKTKAQRRNLLTANGIIAAALLIVVALVGWNVGAMPKGNSPVIADPKPGDAVGMTISVSGSSPRGSLPSGTNFYVLVKPQGFDYWVQLPPSAIPPETSSTGWRAPKVGIGQEGDRGMGFGICAILTGETLSPGWHAPALPPGFSHCIDVTRN